MHVTRDCGGKERRGICVAFSIGDGGHAAGRSIRVGRVRRRPRKDCLLATRRIVLTPIRITMPITTVPNLTDPFAPVPDEELPVKRDEIPDPPPEENN